MPGTKKAAAKKSAPKKSLAGPESALLVENRKLKRRISELESALKSLSEQLQWHQRNKK